MAEHPEAQGHGAHAVAVQGRQERPEQTPVRAEAGGVSHEVVDLVFGDAEAVTEEVAADNVLCHLRVAEPPLSLGEPNRYLAEAKATHRRAVFGHNGLQSRFLRCGVARRKDVHGGRIKVEGPAALHHLLEAGPVPAAGGQPEHLDFWIGARDSPVGRFQVRLHVPFRRGVRGRLVH